ncbi:MAG TPA: hypothetical protein VMI54_29570 [Polyangiaceae bacterium]|nr:hypothetical protein [Polyangiaceae bacterium]
MQKSRIERALVVYEVMSGLRAVPDDAPAWVAVLLPLWWCALILAAVVFGGPGVKFAYIDF